MKEYTSRKFIFSLIVTAVTTTMLVQGYINADAYVPLMSAVVFGYMGGNVGEHFANRGNTHG